MLHEIGWLDHIILPLRETQFAEIVGIDAG